MNRKRLLELAGRSGVDALVAATPENVAYFGGYRSYTQLHLKNKVFALLRPGAREATLVAPLIDTGTLAVSDPFPGRVAFYGRFFIAQGKGRRSGVDARAERYVSEDWPLAKPTAIEALAHALLQERLSSSTIAVDDEGMTYDTFSRLKAALPGAKMVMASQLMREVRMVKTREEVELLRRSTRIAERAIEAGLRSVGEETTERSLAEAIGVELARGAEPGIVNAYGGKESAYVLRPHLDRRIPRGAQIWLDVGCYYEGYCSDTGTTAVRGEAGEKLSRYHEAVVRGQRKAIELVSAGVKPSELHRVAVDEVRKTIPMFRRDQVGHGLGLEHYEPPSLSAANDSPLLEGMVINVETPYYERGFGGLMVEDTLLVKKDGYELLTELDKGLRQVG